MLQADPAKVSSRAKKRGLPQVRVFCAMYSLLLSPCTCVHCSWVHWEQATTMLRSRW